MRDAHKIRNLTEYVFHASFPSTGVEEKLFGQEVCINTPRWNWRQSAGKETSPSTSVQSVVLGPHAETILFLRYNYARYRLSQLTRAQATRTAQGMVRRRTDWLRLALESRNNLIEANMGLILTMAKRICIPDVEFDELVSEGSLALLDACVNSLLKRPY